MRTKILLVVFLFSSICAFTQNRKKQSYNNIGDSIVLNYLRDCYPDKKIGWSEITLKDKKQKVRNYDSHLSFRLPVGSGDTIVAVNFGINNDHEPSYLLVLNKKKTELKYIILGKESLNIDILSLQKFISSLDTPIKEQYQLEIWNLFIKCRQGIFSTPLYLH